MYHLWNSAARNALTTRKYEKRNNCIPGTSLPTVTVYQLAPCRESYGVPGMHVPVITMTYQILLRCETTNKYICTCTYLAKYPWYSSTRTYVPAECVRFINENLDGAHAEHYINREKKKHSTSWGHQQTELSFPPSPSHEAEAPRSKGRVNTVTTSPPFACTGKPTIYLYMLLLQRTRNSIFGPSLQISYGYHSFFTRVIAH